MTRKYVLDASALLALIRNEPGAERVHQILDDSQIHAVNLVEVIRKMVDKGMPASDAERYLRELNLDVIEEFIQAQAYAVAKWTDAARRFGLSLGDCVCLMAAHWSGRAAVTADKRWSHLDGVEIEIVQIR